jgi:hypothetical protein
MKFEGMIVAHQKSAVTASNLNKKFFAFWLTKIIVFLKANFFAEKCLKRTQIFNAPKFHKKSV